ncbi:MAG TPA: hypothetical protein VD815_04535 [Candidatus Saccharimonadales bacterium]|nr:hypothetical protein [Candidatus Saccharimonadales bacterium]
MINSNANNMIIRLSDNSKIAVRLNENEITKLKTIVEDLFESKAIKSKDIEDFLKFTIFIVFDEYEKNTESLKKFYLHNLSNYDKSQSK